MTKKRARSSTPCRRSLRPPPPQVGPPRHRQQRVPHQQCMAHLRPRVSTAPHLQLRMVAWHHPQRQPTARHSRPLPPPLRPPHPQLHPPQLPPTPLPSLSFPHARLGAARTVGHPQPNQPQAVRYPALGPMGSVAAPHPPQAHTPPQAAVPPHRALPGELPGPPPARPVQARPVSAQLRRGDGAVAAAAAGPPCLPPSAAPQPALVARAPRLVLVLLVVVVVRARLGRHGHSVPWVSYAALLAGVRQRAVGMGVSGVVVGAPCRPRAGCPAVTMAQHSTRPPPQPPRVRQGPCVPPSPTPTRTPSRCLRTLMLGGRRAPVG